MRLTRLFRILLLAPLTLACRGEEMPCPQETGTPIRFCAEPELVVKSNLDVPGEENHLIADGNQIGVFATWVSESNVSTNVFNKLPVTCYDDGEQANPRYRWDYNPHKYWRQGGQYFFRAVYPYDVNTQFGTDGTRIVTSYSMLADNYDLMVAGASRDLRSGNDTAPVNFQFKHACAAVRVLFKKGTEDVNRHYYLNSFELQNLRCVGILAYGGEELNLNSWEAAEFRTPTVCTWQASTEQDRLDVPGDYDSFKTITDHDWVQWHYVIPQRLRANDGKTPSLQFSVSVRQYEEDGETLAYESTSPVYTTLDLPLTYRDDQNVERDVVWEPGKVYTYYVQIQPGRASITVSVADWDRYYLYVDDVIIN